MVVGVLACYALLCFTCDLKATWTNVLCSLIWQFMLYEFELVHNDVEPIKTICWVKGKGTVDHSTVTRWFKKFCSDYKNLNNQERSGRLKSMALDTLFQAREARRLTLCSKPEKRGAWRFVPSQRSTAPDALFQAREARRLTLCSKPEKRGSWRFVPSQRSKSHKLHMKSIRWI